MDDLQKIVGGRGGYLKKRIVDTEVGKKDESTAFPKGCLKCGHEVD